MKLKKYLLLLALLPFLQGCNNEDDIGAIFSGSWKLNNFYTTTDWDNHKKSTPVYDFSTSEGRKAIEQINQSGKFIISFSEGSFSATADEKNFSGTWQADGKENTFFGRITSGGSSSDAIGKKFIEAVRDAKFYKGDVNYLQLYSEEKDEYIQLRREN